MTFAICISTLFAVEDFSLGFYGAAVDYKSGLFPRMRGPAHLMAYRDSGRIVVLDYHAEYFLEFVLVHFLSEVTGLNYIFTYFFTIKALVIMIWSVLFVWSSTLVRTGERRVWMLLLASSILLAHQSYNLEYSFAPILLLLFYFVTKKEQCRSFTLVVLLTAFAVLFASFRETLLLGLVSLITLCVILWNKIGGNMQPKLSPARTSANVVILVIASTRTFLTASPEYFEGYAHRLFAIIDNLWATLTGSWTIKHPPLISFVRIQKPLDRSIALMSVIFAVSLLIFIAIFSSSLILKRRLDPFSLAISAVFIIALSIPVGAYITQKFTGHGAIYDFATATFLARSLAPLTVLAMMSYSQKIKERHFRAKKLLFILVMVSLSLTLIFGPFIFYREGIKSRYDMVRVFGDTSEYAILGNSEYEFVVSHLPIQSKIVILSPAQGFIQHFLALPLLYETTKSTGAPIRIHVMATAPVFASRIFDNNLFTTSAYEDTIFLDELPLYYMNIRPP